MRTIGRGSRNLYKKDLSRVSRLEAEPNDLRLSFELTRENQKEKATPRALQCSLIYGPGAHTQSYTRYHNTINSSSNSPLTESYWPRSKSRGATNVSATSALGCFIFFEPRGQVNLVLVPAELLLSVLTAPPHCFSFVSQTASSFPHIYSVDPRQRARVATFCAGGFNVFIEHLFRAFVCNRYSPAQYVMTVINHLRFFVSFLICFFLIYDKNCDTVTFHT